MKRTSFLLLVAIFIVSVTSVAAQTEPLVVKLWPEGAPNDNGLTGEEIIESNSISNVTEPTLIVFPADRPNGMAIIACPGGGYRYLAFEHEGTDMADWYNAQGITYAVLKYRMPNGHQECPESDIRQAMHIMHSHASEWGIDHCKIGVQGASAGGHLASWISKHYEGFDERPAFQVLFYPAIYMNNAGANTPPNESSKETQQRIRLSDVTAATPPAFLMCSTDDGLCGNHVLRYFNELKDAGVHVALHVYPEGGHGWGFRDSFKYKRQWTGELEKWLQDVNAEIDNGKAVVIQQKSIDDGGTGPYKAIAAKVSTLEDYVIYRPADLLAAAESEGNPLPLMIFANGSCLDSSGRYQSMLSEIASHGYVVIALGELQMDRVLDGSHSTRSSQIIYAIDWMERQTSDKQSEYYGVVDMRHIATSGHSCGGAQVLATATDSRIGTCIIYNAGMGNSTAMAGADRNSLKKLHTPVLYMPGGKEDIADANARTDYENIDNVPVTIAVHPTAGHIGAFDEPQGGSYARLTLAWLDWQLKGNKQGEKIFVKGNSEKYPEFEIKSKNFK